MWTRYGRACTDPAAQVRPGAAPCRLGPRGTVACSTCSAMKARSVAPVLRSRTTTAHRSGAAIKASVRSCAAGSGCSWIVAKGRPTGRSSRKSLAAVEERNPDREARAVPVINRLASATPAERPDLLKALARIGGPQALRVVADNGRSKDPETREAALRALTDWTSMEAFDSLIVLARSKEKLPLRVLALRACVRLVEAAPCSAVTAVRYHERTLAAAERIEEKRLVLGALANINSPDALRLLVPYISDDSLGLEAAMASWKIAKTAERPCVCRSRAPADRTADPGTFPRAGRAYFRCA